ncbi:ras-GEF domain-containing family member 1B-like isoform X1 [Ostrinia furnacalis]|uniref:ras-GEF domain-containing family member 1B-like isoform X1 n=1 Tax=Ostrinia furnacalis TaxID=93504 RepID=UPI001038CD58|nr:ras-GEF domain-containing family member 1B-like isoform X1 [Ostrinia furnacalis]XP_028179159.1 ras-GEF domain-containing family member 1B-like isoform X1 [Ostrinia furnacalis]XP_028179162.1 ras-GEF domain-containing family member 1B-like isoform X1 [Ostrinia furnacalis]
MAMYYYASKLNEASCSGCNIKVPPAPTEPAPVPPPPTDHAPLPPDPSLLHGTGLSYYDNDDYYSMVRGNKFMSETSCKHIVMNGGLNFVSSQKVETPQLTSVLGPGVKSLSTLPYPPADKSDIEYKDGQIISAPLETLVDMLRPGASKSFMFTFLLCSRLFVKPHELLSKLCKRYFKNYDKIGKSEVKDLIDKELNDMIALVRVLNQWTSMFPYDFRDDRVMALVRSITQRCAAEHMASVRLEVSTMLEKLLDKLTALEQYEETLNEIPQVSTVDQLAQGDILTLGLSPVELANQLTVVELHRLSFVGPEEFVQTFAPAQPPQSTSTSGKSSINLHHIETKSTRNLEAYADWFNRLSYLVATDILKSAKSKYRARVIEQWVMTARECFNLGNFNSLMAIISALNMSSITRLKKTWGRTSGVCGQQLRQLELCVEPSGNHARYRAALAAAPTETAVPLLSVTCRDLHFANQGAPSKIGGNRVNFEKCSLLARHVCTQLAARRLASDEAPAPALPPPHRPVWRFLNERPALSETALELTSFEREPPADHLEKERLKRLRGAS